jgi:Protein of unknown function (DUF3986)
MIRMKASDNTYEDFHLHLGYYVDENDFEAIALKRMGVNVWDIYFDFDHYQMNRRKDRVYVPYFGSKILEVHSKNLSYEDGSFLFEKWLRKNSII